MLPAVPAVLALLAPAALPATLDAAVAAVVDGSPGRDEVMRYAGAAAARAFPDDAGLQRAVIGRIEENLEEKARLPPLDGARFTLSAAEAKAQVVDFEIWKMQTFVAAGVFPKRYFGYFDERWDTAAREREMREAVRCATGVVDAEAGAVHVSDMEVAVTFIAEGGALLLREKQASLDAIHPVLDIGLDDIATGFARAPGTVARLDASCGTRLGAVIAHDERGRPLLARKLTFREGLAATALMYEYEKGLARDKLRAEGVDIAKLTLAQQFVAGSLVYNSGVLFSSTSRRHIEALTTAKDVWETSVKNEKTRWLLPVWPPGAARRRLRGGEPYPVQPTSWSGMYHVLQRYGAFVALQRFTAVFDEAGAYRRRS